jgi:hydroxymethylglutaryl-CoA lyase
MLKTLSVQLVECPRDAIQGWGIPISTEQKTKYINSLLLCGFDTIDFGSFVSPKAIPQMADTQAVLDALVIPENNTTKLLAIVANIRGAEAAAENSKIDILGFPFSISPTFQLRNTNSSMEQSWEILKSIQEICHRQHKQLVVYLSMGFGNPYADPYSHEILLEWADKMVEAGIEIISLADTVGLASPDQISSALKILIPKYPETIIGVHLHASKNNWQAKMDAALNAGCLRFDGAINGIGGCPMAQDQLVGNMDTISIIAYLKELKRLPNLNELALAESRVIADEIFSA